MGLPAHAVGLYLLVVAGPHTLYESRPHTAYVPIRGSIDINPTHAYLFARISGQCSGRPVDKAGEVKCGASSRRSGRGRKNAGRWKGEVVSPTKTRSAAVT